MNQQRTVPELLSGRYINHRRPHFWKTIDTIGGYRVSSQLGLFEIANILKPGKVIG